MPTHWPRLTMAGPLLRGSGELHIVGPDDVMTISDPDGAVHRLLALADGSRTRAQIVRVLASEFPLLCEHDVEQVLCELQTIGLLEDCAPLEDQPHMAERESPPPTDRPT